MNIFKKALKAFSDNLALLSGFIITLSGISTFSYNFFENFIPKPYLLFVKYIVLYIGILIIVITICNTIIFLKKKDYGFKTSESFVYKKWQRLLSQIVKWFMMLLSLFFIYKLFQIYQKEQSKCNISKLHFGVFVSNFSNNEKDEVSSQLLIYLRQRINDSSFILKPISKFLDAKSSLSPQDSIVPHMGCFNKGLVISGSRSLTENSFYCSIYIQTPESDTKNIIDIQEPKLIEFSTINQVQYIGNFVIALIAYKQKNFTKAIVLIDSIQKLRGYATDEKFKAVCFLLKGNAFFKTGQLDSAQYNYEYGIKFDSENPLLNKNLTECLKTKEIKRINTEPYKDSYSSPTEDTSLKNADSKNIDSNMVDFTNKLIISKSAYSYIISNSKRQDSHYLTYAYRFNDYSCIGRIMDTSKIWVGYITTQFGVRFLFVNQKDSSSAITEMAKYFERHK